MAAFTKLFTCMFFLVISSQLRAQEIIPNQQLSKMKSELSDSDLVCQLTGPELIKRKNALQQEVFHKVRKISEQKEGFTFYFDDEDEFLLKLTDYMLAEKKCCPFFSFKLSIGANNAGIALTVTGPPEAKELLKEMVKKE